MIKALIFDCFGVVISDGFDLAYRSLGGDFEKDQEFIKQTIQDASSGKIQSSIPVFAKKLGVSDELWAETIRKDRKVNYELLEYTKELRESYKVAMLTNIGKAGVRRAFDPGLLEKYFDPIVESAQIGYAKPEANAYEITADMIGVRLDECVFIDDRQDYVDGAKAVGMQAILYKDLPGLKIDLTRVLT